MTNAKFPLRRVRSFVRRDGRMTQAQSAAFEKNWRKVGLEVQKGPYNFKEIFANESPLVLEIGFGMGTSFIDTAKSSPHHNFIGIETHLPGIGRVLVDIESHQLTNVRLFYADAIEVLERAIPDESFDIVQIFFPDPWPKRRHHKRRLIQPDFVNLISSKLKKGGAFHLATDWEDYAKEMMSVLSSAKDFINVAGAGHFAQRSSQRMVVTKFERRSQNEGRKVWELQFIKQ